MSSGWAETTGFAPAAPSTAYLYGECATCCASRTTEGVNAMRRAHGFSRISACLMLPAAASSALAQSADILAQMNLQSDATLERGIMVPMRDGIRLSTAVIRPVNAGGRVPVILIRTPYEKNGELIDPVLTTLVR